MEQAQAEHSYDIVHSITIVCLSSAGTTHETSQAFLLAGGQVFFSGTQFACLTDWLSFK